MSPSVRHSAQPITILVAEDSKYDRMILQQAFGELGLNVSLHFVDNGEAVLDYLHRRNAFAVAATSPRPALVLMDLNMPRMNGQETLLAIREDEALRSLPVIVLSTSDSPKQIDQAYKNGVNAFVTKPGRYDEFVDLVSRLGAFWLTTARLPGVSARHC
jgi:CheY-like chemotaxis protein